MYRRIMYGVSAVLLSLGLVTAASPAPAAPVSHAAANNSVAAAKPVLDLAHKPKGVPLGKTVKKALPGQIAPRTHTTCGSGCFSWSGDGQGYNGTPISPAATGVSANFSVEKPYLDLSDYHSLAEIAIFDPTQGNTIEIGWNVDRGVNSLDTNPHLFVFSWLHGVGNSYNGSPFVSVTGCSPCMGDALTSDIGTSKVLQLQYLPGAAVPGWYAAYNGNYFAGIPDTYWSGQTPASSFTGIDHLQVFGEMATTYKESCSDMGTGDPATGSPNFDGGKIGSYTLYGTTVAANLSGYVQTDATGWPLVDGYSNTAIRYGGPGYDSVGYGRGYKGTCAGATERAGIAGDLMTNREYCPGGQTTTGCNMVIDRPYASDTINVIHTLPANQQDIVQAWGDYQVSGKSYYLCASSSCASSSRVFIGNAAKVNVLATLGGYPHAYERAS